MRQRLKVITAVFFSIHLHTWTAAQDTTANNHEIFSIGLTANGGLSYLLTKANLMVVGSIQKFYFVPSGNGGLFFRFHFNDKSSFGTELLFAQIEGKEQTKIPVTDNYGNLTGQFIIEDIRRHISYLIIPIYYGQTINKFTIDAGLQASLALTGSFNADIQSPIPIYGDTNGKLSIKNYPFFGVRLGFSFSLTKNISVSAKYYYGELANINKYNSPPYSKKQTVQQGTIGLSYKLFSHQRQTTATEKK